MDTQISSPSYHTLSLEQQKGLIDKEIRTLESALSDPETDLALKCFYAKRLNQAKHARKRTVEGKWVICERCGGEIEYSRIKTLVTVTTCTSCEKKTARLPSRSSMFASPHLAYS